MRVSDRTLSPQVFLNKSTSFNSDVIPMRNETFFCTQITFDGNASATLTVQTSNNGTDWNTVLNSSQAITAPGSHTYEIFDVCSPMYRISVAISAGTSTFTIYPFSKGNS